MQLIFCELPSPIPWSLGHITPPLTVTSFLSLSKSCCFFLLDNLPSFLIEKLQTLSWTLGPSCSVPSPFRHSASRPAPAFSPSDAVLCSGEAGPCWVWDESPGDESGSVFVSALPCRSLWTLRNLLNLSRLGYLLCRVQRVFIFIVIWNFWKLHFREGTGLSDSETAGWWTHGWENLINSVVWEVWVVCKRFPLTAS